LKIEEMVLKEKNGKNWLTKKILVLMIMTIEKVDNQNIRTITI